MKERIEQILKDKRLTQAEFAIRADISPATITHLFNGRNNLSEAVVSKILLAYPEINPVWLLDGMGEKYRKTNEHLPLFDETQAKEEKQISYSFPLIPQNEVQNPDNQLEKEENRQMFPATESPIAQVSPAAQAIAPTANVQKQIKKIVFFYADKTFEEYYPQ
jgi:transcriptional regulator with XRE-family HTH domain